MISVKNITKSYGKNKVIDNFSYDILDGDFVCVCGKSGSGKTTLINILSLLEKPSSGEIIFDKQSSLSAKAILLLQRYKLGYLFQNYALVENETVRRNLNVALTYKKLSKSAKQAAMIQALQRLELQDCLEKKIYQLSGGEQQRVAIARMLLKDPEYIFADEPTGNLDEYNRDIVFNVLKELNQQKKTIIYVSHDTELIKKANTIIELGGSI
ncbi:ATP-binding cassette domain-containing protein [Erwinia sp. CPCC 100877]|nr:ATP-binding cassette domain-containing protein [Erwinia sp. CPCC 100877]